MQTRRWRTFWRLFGTYAVLVLAVVALLGKLIVSRVERFELKQIHDSLNSKAALIEGIVEESPVDLMPRLEVYLQNWSQQLGARITLIGVDGAVLADSHEQSAKMENHAGRPEIVQAREEGVGRSTRHSRTVGESMMYVARRTNGKSSVAYIRVARPLDQVEQELAQLDSLVWTFAGLSAVAVLALAFWLARRITKPLQELTAGAERIAAGDYGHKVYALAADEIGSLARAFNIMSERLAQQFRQVEEDRQKLRTVLGGMVEGVIAIDGQQRVLFANERAASLLDFPGDAVVGRRLWEVVRQRAIQEVVQRAERSTEPHREELDWNGPAVKSLAVYVARLPGSPSSPSGGAVLVLQDTTELHRLERLRREFVANVSHELKTPLSVIKVCTETLQDGGIEDAENRGGFLEQIDEQANRLHALILDLISLARIESGAEVFDFQNVPLPSLIADCVERHRGRAEAKQQVLEAVGSGQWAVGSERTGNRTAGEAQPIEAIDDSSLPTAWADEEAVSQILDNLVDNAVKYTSAGGRIQVSAYCEERNVCLEVRDDGIGIPERDLPRIFERFYRVDKARSRELGGTGLGLSIVKHLVQAMNGTITASSQLQQGSTFSVRLPRAAARPG
jgi:two-component system phosphate regulon sensor histidine kinase PhoR